MKKYEDLEIEYSNACALIEDLKNQVNTLVKMKNEENLSVQKLKNEIVDLKKTLADYEVDSKCNMLEEEIKNRDSKISWLKNGRKM